MGESTRLSVGGRATNYACASMGGAGAGRPVLALVSRIWGHRVQKGISLTEAGGGDAVVWLN